MVTRVAARLRPTTAWTRARTRRTRETPPFAGARRACLSTARLFIPTVIRVRGRLDFFLFPPALGARAWRTLHRHPLPPAPPPRRRSPLGSIPPRVAKYQTYDLQQLDYLHRRPRYRSAPWTCFRSRLIILRGPVRRRRRRRPPPRRNQSLRLHRCRPLRRNQSLRHPPC